MDAAQLVRRAFTLQRQGALDDAASLYREVLAVYPNHADCWHMLGVVCLRQKRFIEGVDCIEHACIVDGWRHQACLINLFRGLEELVAALPEPADPLAPGRLVMAQRASRAAARSCEPAPLVSVLVPAYQHARFVADALQSIFVQTYEPLELIIIDDGSTDSTAEIIRDALRCCPVRHQFVTRSNRGAHATINECIALASGRYINVLNSDDEFAPHRIEKMVQAVHQGGADWGYSRCALIDENGLRATDADEKARRIRAMSASMHDCEHTSHRFVTGNPAISTGNIFASREFVQNIGGFANLRYNHDWAFCLDAIWYSEPVMVDAELYRYRVHDANTISERPHGAREEARLILAEYFAKAEKEVAPNALALTKATYPARFHLAKLMQIAGGRISAESIQREVRRIREIARAIWEHGSDDVVAQN